MMTPLPSRRVTFEEVSIKGVKHWKDPVTGRPRQRTRIFMQTINPFNKDDRGEPKLRDQILKEIKRERDEWLAIPPPYEED